VTAETPAEAADESLPVLPQDHTSAPAAAATPALPDESVSAEAAQAPRVRVVTDVLDVTIGLRGGELDGAALERYPLHKDQPDVPVRLLTTTTGNDLFVVRSGLRAADGRPEPTHLSMYTAASDEYTLAPSADEVTVPLTWQDESGLTVTKRFTFQRSSYVVDVSYDVVNDSATDWRAASYVQFLRHYHHVKRSMFDVETYAYRGPAIFDGEKVRKLDVEDDDRGWTASMTGGWMAAMQHHFVVAAVPPAGQSYDYALDVPDSRFLLSYRGPLQTVSAHDSGRFEERLFIGPKLQDQLKAIAPKLERTADYGKLTIIAEPLFWLLEKVHDVVGNWGWAIVIVTFLIKLVFYKLTETSGRSMAKMRNLTPRIKNLQERYKDDREALGRAMMEMYKREKINPLAGCLPILVQIPVFLSFYWVLLESVEMRQAPFLGWINDLSSRDPFFILPALMGVAMFGQFKLNPAPPDPMQAKIFAFMPIVMTAMMAWFPAGLVLYWLTNTLLSIAQQWKINKVVEAEAKKH
jgi:YidC/Oxa1 family membrane protein insertase